MTNQPTQHQPPRVQLAIAGMLPAGVTVRITPQAINLRFDGDGPIEIVYLGQTNEGWHIKRPYNLPLYIKADQLRKIATYLQSAADMCDWLNDNWKPE